MTVEEQTLTDDEDDLQFVPPTQRMSADNIDRELQVGRLDLERAGGVHVGEGGGGPAI